MESKVVLCKLKINIPKPEKNSPKAEKNINNWNLKKCFQFSEKFLKSIYFSSKDKFCFIIKSIFIKRGVNTLKKIKNVRFFFKSSLDIKKLIEAQFKPFCMMNIDFKTKFQINFCYFRVYESKPVLNFLLSVKLASVEFYRIKLTYMLIQANQWKHCTSLKI